MADWRERDGTHRATVGDNQLIVSPTMYDTFTYAVMNNERIVHSSNTQTLEEAIMQAERTAAALPTR